MQVEAKALQARCVKLAPEVSNIKQEAMRPHTYSAAPAPLLDLTPLPELGGHQARLPSSF